MKMRVLTLVTSLLVLPQLASANLSDVVCDDTARLENQLTNVVGAERRAQGVRDPDALIEIWIVPRNGDWTMVQNYANGTSCILAMGENWEQLVASPA